MAGDFLGKLSEKFGPTGTNEKEIKCVIVGDNAVGKTKLICSFVYNLPGYDINTLNTPTHTPTIFARDNVDKRTADFQLKRKIGKRNINLMITDTFGDHQKDREYSYQKANVLLLCFNIGCLSSLEHVVSHWYPEVKKFCENVPIILVGTQADRRHNAPERYATKGKKIQTLREYLHWDTASTCSSTSTTISANRASCNIESEIGRKVAQDIGAFLYYETSVSTKHGVQDLFAAAMKVGLMHKMKASRKSEILSAKMNMMQLPFLKEKSPPTPFIVPKDDFNTRALFHSFYSPFQRSEFQDVEFVFNDNTQMFAHSVVLAMSNRLFERLFKQVQNHLDKVLEGSTPDDFLFNHVTTKDNGNVCYDFFQLDPNEYSVFSNITVTYEPTRKLRRYSFLMDSMESLSDFGLLLEIYYKGKIDSIDIASYSNVKDLLELSTQLKFSFPKNYLLNIMKNRADQNQNYRDSYSSLVLKMGSIFVQTDHLSDVQFILDGNISVPAHRVILSQRCEVLKAMLHDGNFVESLQLKIEFPDTSLESFHALLEYLYTGECDKISDLHGTLQLANFLCLPRLVAICEQKITCHIGELVEARSKDLYSFVIASYIVGEYHNAPQLTAWCKHFMATNYNELCRDQGKDLKALLDEETLKYLEENRWPPVWYLKEQDYYERTMRQMKLEHDRKKEQKRKRTCSGCF